MGPVHRFKELKDALGSAPLRRLRLNAMTQIMMAMMNITC